MIRRASENDIPLIQNLAQKIWPVAYKEMISTDQINYMLDLIYSVDALKEQIQKGHQFIIYEEHNLPIAFASFSKKSESESATFRLHKLYVLTTEQTKGIGRKLIEYIITEIKSPNASSLELNVNRSNKALHFYQKLGFEIIMDEDIDIGGGYFMNDYVMRKKV